MWIQCACGNEIHDVTDGLYYKAHYISDQDWFDIWDKIDLAIKSSESDRDKLCSEVFTFCCKRTKSMYQCHECGRLYVDDSERELCEFKPDVKNINVEILRSK